jgi:hypothetical protein
VVAAGALVTTALVVTRDRPVRVTPPPAAADTRESCERLNTDLPRSVDGQDRRATTPHSVVTAAWGDPAVVLRCGVPRPAGLQPTSQFVTVDGIDWLPEQRADGYTFTTVGRAAYVEASVPSAYAPEVNALADLAGAISRTIPPVGKE